MANGDYESQEDVGWSESGGYESAMAQILTQANNAPGLEQFAPQIEKLMKEMNQGTQFPLWMQIAMPKIVARLENSKKKNILNQINAIGLGLKFEKMRQGEEPAGKYIEKQPIFGTQPAIDEGTAEEVERKTGTREVMSLFTPPSKSEGIGRILKSREKPKTKIGYHKAGETIFAGPEEIEEGKPIPKMTEVAKGEKEKPQFSSYKDVLDFMKNNPPPKGKVWGLTSTKDGWNVKDENPPTDPKWQMKIENFGSYQQEIFFNPETQEVKYGKKTPIQESPATVSAKDRQKKSLALDLSKQFKRDPVVQGFPIIQNQMDRLEEAAQEAQQTNNYVGIDQTLINVFNKMLDERSVVRESEYARTPKDMNIWNKIAGQIDKYTKTGGAGLTNDERNAIYSMGKRFFERYKRRYEDIASETRQKALLYEVDPDMVVPPPKVKKELPTF